jgi:hypothetical protein
MPPSQAKDAILGMVIVHLPSEATLDSSSASSYGDPHPHHLSPAEAANESKQQNSESLFSWLYDRRRFFLLLFVFLITTATISLALVLAENIVKNKGNQNQTVAGSTTDARAPTPAPSVTLMRSTRAPSTNILQGQEGAASSQVESTPASIPTSSTFMTASAECPAVLSPAPFAGKKGVGFTLRNEGLKGSWTENLPNVIALDPYWNYRWGLDRIEDQPDNIEFVPMVWGGGGNPDKLQQKLTRKLLPHIESGKVKRLLGFNEPDKTEQSNMTTTEALDMWPTLESTGLPLVSPSCAQPDGEWMKDFMTAAEERCYRLDWLGVHWYGGANFGAFKRKMENIYITHGSQRPLLITEFAPADWNAQTPADNKWSQADVLGFMKQALPWLEATDWISGYAWFSFKTSSAQGTSSALFDEQGAITACGRFYASVRADNPTGDQTITVDE